jgi:hypothetical protein
MVGSKNALAGLALLQGNSNDGNFGHGSFFWLLKNFAAIAVMLYREVLSLSNENKDSFDADRFQVFFLNFQAIFFH